MSQLEPAPIADDLGAQVARSIVRHVISVTAGGLVSVGALAPSDEVQFNAIAGGIALYAISQGWSIVRKWSTARGK